MGCNCRGLQFLDGGWALLVFCCLATALAVVAGHLGVCGGGPWLFGCLHPRRSGWFWVCCWKIRFCGIFREIGHFVFGFVGKDGSKGLERGQFLGVNTSKRTVRSGIVHGGNETSQGGVGGVFGKSFWYWGVFWEPFDGLSYAFGARFNDEGLVTVIVKCRWAEVTHGGAMGCPAFSFAWCIVGNCLRSKRAEGSSIEI